MKKKLLILLALTTLSANALANEVEEKKEKKWKLSFGVDHNNEQSGMANDSRSAGYSGTDYPGADDLNESGDVTTIFTTLGYKVNDKWALDYTYKVQDISNNETYGADSDRDNGMFIGHTVRLIRTLPSFDKLGKTWNHSFYVGFLNYRESSMRDKDSDSYTYNGFSSNRLLLNYNINTMLTPKTRFTINNHYQYRDYDNDNSAVDYGNQHRNYLFVIFDHKFNDNWKFKFSNTYYFRHQSNPNVTGQYRHEWQYNYVLTHTMPISEDYRIESELRTWGEYQFAVNQSKDNRPDHQQGEVSFMPKLVTDISLKEVDLTAYVGAGYVYGYDTHTLDNMYKGFEGRIGFVGNYKF